MQRVSLSSPASRGSPSRRSPACRGSVASTGTVARERRDGACWSSPRRVSGETSFSAALRPSTRQAVRRTGCATVTQRPRLWLSEPRTPASRDPLSIADINGGTIQGLQIVFDEGNDVGQGFVFLDNITVEINGVPHQWTGPMDNGGGVGN